MSDGGVVGHWTVVIPARLGSERFPGKVLADVGGGSVLEHVWRAAVEAVGTADVTVLTDSDELVAHVVRFGGRARLTSPDARNGTERAAEHLADHDAEAVMNVQGDDPFVTPELLRAAMAAHDGNDAPVTTPVHQLADGRDDDPNVVKVVRGVDGDALYFSRAPIPLFRDGDTPARQPRWGHVGLYCYDRAALARYATLPEGILEAAEKLEQLRFLEHGITVRTFETSYVPSAIDTPADLARLTTARPNPTGPEDAA